MSRFIECCCDGLEAAREAWAGGADRIELCADLPVGGVTPPHDIIRQAVAEASGRPVNVLVRPRAGDFVYTRDEVAAMLESIGFCRVCGVNAVVAGALLSDGRIDTAAMKELVSAAEGMKVTFHRAFDECLDPFVALEEIISLGCHRLLSSGHDKDAMAGRDTLKRLVDQAGGRIVVMPGCGINPGNISEIEACTGAAEFHSSAKGPDGKTCRHIVEQLKNI